MLGPLPSPLPQTVMMKRSALETPAPAALLWTCAFLAPAISEGPCPSSPKIQMEGSITRPGSDSPEVEVRPILPKAPAIGSPFTPRSEVL